MNQMVPTAPGAGSSSSPRVQRGTGPRGRDQRNGDLAAEGTGLGPVTLEVEMMNRQRPGVMCPDA